MGWGYVGGIYIGERVDEAGTTLRPPPPWHVALYVLCDTTLYKKKAYQSLKTISLSGFCNVLDEVDADILFVFEPSA